MAFAQRKQGMMSIQQCIDYLYVVHGGEDDGKRDISLLYFGWALYLSSGVGYPLAEVTLMTSECRAGHVLLVNFCVK